MVKLGNDWDEVLNGEFEKPYYIEIREFLKKEYATQIVYPDMYDIFNALKATSFKDTKVVILGQDPYHNPGQAHGMSFSVKPGIMPPPSLQNMYKEIENEFGYEMPKKYGYLQSWAQQGVLLLNTVLTVRQNQPQSHKNCGWETFTDNVIASLNQKQEPCVFLLWGSNAKSKAKLITNKKHLILTAVHPSPLSAYRGFFGCNHFKLANEFLKENGIKEIDWKITEDNQ